MMKYRKFAALAAAAALILSLGACRAGGETEPSGTAGDTASAETTASPETTPTQPVPSTQETEQEVPTETVPFEPVETVPVAPVEPIVSDPVAPGTEGVPLEDLQVVRTQDVAQSVLENLIAQNPSADGLAMMQMKDLEALEELLNRVGSRVLTDAAEQYGEEFFREYDLIVIPRVTTTGSVLFSASASAQGGVYQVEITLSIPEITTMDMANWFLLIPAPKADTQGRTVRAVIAGGFGTPELNPAPTTGFVFG